MMLLIVPVRVQNSWCMDLRSVSWDISVPSGVRLLVVLLVVVWPVVSDILIYDGFLDVYMFCMLHVLYISQQKETWQSRQDRRRLDAAKEKDPHMGPQGSTGCANSLKDVKIASCDAANECIVLAKQKLADRSR
jgi:hypothetical protein